MLGKIGGKRRRRWLRMRWLDGITDSTDRTLIKLWETAKDRQAWRAEITKDCVLQSMGSQRVRHG